jgi:hypothetical protein
LDSTLTWLAHSESERRQTQEIIRRLDEPGTLDEIGVGRIRDALANLLFPGTSTLHTRARYLLFIPWIYRELELRSPMHEDVGHRARQREIRLIDALKRQRELDDDELPSGELVDDVGIIGERAGSSLSQLPSEAYWNALHVWGVRPVDGSRSAYHRQLEQVDLRHPAVDDDGEPLPGAIGSWWDRGLPAAPHGFLQLATLALSADEAAYLQERATTKMPDSALAQLLALEHPLEPTTGMWEQPSEVLDCLTAENRDLLSLADRFSAVMWGASHLYDRLVAEEADRPEAVALVDERLAGWRGLVADRHDELEEWRSEIERFWEVVKRSNPRIPSAGEEAFVTTWARLALTADDVAQASEARDLVRDREKQLKRGLAKLGNPSALEAWEGPARGRRLVFRWPNAQQLIADIQWGLGIRDDTEDLNA